MVVVRVLVVKVAVTALVVVVVVVVVPGMILRTSVASVGSP